MTIDDKITDEKLRNHINREAAEISALSSGKIDKYEYFTGEEILLNINIILVLIKHLKNKSIEDQRIKQVEALKAVKSGK